MRRSHSSAFACSLAGILALILAAPSARADPPFSRLASSTSPIRTLPTSTLLPNGGEIRGEPHLAAVRIPFVANAGQTDAAVAYYASTFSGTVFVTKDGDIVYSLPGERHRSGAAQLADPTPSTGGWSLTETVVGGTARPRASDAASARVNYFVGNDPARWRNGLPTFDAVSLGEVWPGISLDLRAHGKNVEKLFKVKPGADPSQIRMRVAGARSLRVDGAGALLVATDRGELAFTPPLSRIHHLLPLLCLG